MFARRKTKHNSDNGSRSSFFQEMNLHGSTQHIPGDLGDFMAKYINVSVFQVVNTRVRESDVASGYLNPLPSEASELRIDY